MEDKEKITMICEGKVVTDETFMSWWGVSEETLDKLKKDGLKKGYFEKKVFNDVFRYRLISKKKKKVKVIKDEILFPDMVKKGSKQKYFITDMVKDKNIPSKNTYRTYLTVYGETMPWIEFRERTGLYDSFFRNNRINEAKSFKYNGVEVTIERRPKNIYGFTVTNKATGEVNEKILRKELIEIVGCQESKIDNMGKFNSVVTYKDFIIERVTL